MKYYSPFPSLSVSQYNYCLYLCPSICLYLNWYCSFYTTLSIFSLSLLLFLFCSSSYFYNNSFLPVEHRFCNRVGNPTSPPPPTAPPPKSIWRYENLRRPHPQPLKSIWKFFAKVGFSLKRKTFLQNVQKNWKRCLTSRFNVWNVNTVWFLKLSGFFFCYPKTQRGLFHRFLK